MVYMITDHPTDIVHFDYINHKYYAIEYTNRENDTVDAKHVTSSELITDDNIHCYEEIAHIYEGVYWFATVTPVRMRDVPLDELLWHRFSAEHMMFGKKLYVYCVGDEEFEFACERIYPDNQLVGCTTIWNRDTFFELCGISLDVDDCFEYVELSKSVVYSGKNNTKYDVQIQDYGLQYVGDGKFQVVDWSLFFEYVASEWEVDFVYGGE
jgi:hypothetical protein